MPQCQFPVFSCFCVLEKLHRKYSQNWTKQKPTLLFFPEASRSPKMRRRGARGQAHPRAAWPSPWPRHQGVRPPGPPRDAPFRLCIPLDGKNLKDGSLLLETYCKPPPSLSRDWEDPGALPDTLPEAFSTTMVTSGLMCE
jgi:hypothetical protein